MKLKNRLFSSLLLLVLLALPHFADAQCSMCRAATASNQLSDDAFTVGHGLNNAIIYLMASPYILVAIFVFAWFRKDIKGLFK